MFEVNTLTLVDFLEVGDIIKHGEGVYIVDSLDYRPDTDDWEIAGTDQHWEEQETLYIPDGHMVELMIWVEED